MLFTRVCLALLFTVTLFAQNSVTPAQSDENTTEVVVPSKLIEIEGDQGVERTDLYDALSVDYPAWFKFWDNSPPRIKEKLIPTIPTALQSFYDSEGYYDANFTIEESPDKVRIRISENEPVRVADINISSDADISEIVDFQKGEVFKAKKFIDIKRKIIQQMLHEGYCSYDLDAKAYVDLEKHTVDIRYILKKGDVCTFGNVTIEGLQTIDERIVRSRVRAKEGMRFNTELVQETSTEIYKLRSFDSVLIDIDRKFYNVVPVDIRLKEMEDPYHIELGGGYDTYVGPRVHGSFTKHNFLGNAQQLTLKGSWSSLEKLLILDFYKPVFVDLFGYTFDLGASIGYSDLEFKGFREDKSFAKAFLKYESRELSFVTGLAMETIDISEESDGTRLLPDYAYDLFFLVYPYVDIRWDKRDSKLNPKYGYYLSGYAEMGLPSDSESSLYIKTQLEARGIYTFHQLTMAVVGKIGAIDIMEDSYRGIPESKKFFGGGSYSNRAYGYREIGVILSPTEDLINGALSMANLSVELDYPIWGDLYGAVFEDNTMLTDKSYDYSGEVITSAGFGFRYVTPVGPFKIDVGFNTHDPDIYAISFQIGQSF